MKTQIKSLSIAVFLSISSLKAQEGFIGEIKMFRGNFPLRS